MGLFTSDDVFFFFLLRTGDTCLSGLNEMIDCARWQYVVSRLFHRFFVFFLPDRFSRSSIIVNVSLFTEEQSHSSPENDCYLFSKIRSSDLLFTELIRHNVSLNITQNLWIGSHIRHEVSTRRFLFGRRSRLGSKDAWPHLQGFECAFSRHCRERSEGQDQWNACIDRFIFKYHSRNWIKTGIETEWIWNRRTFVHLVPFCETYRTVRVLFQSRSWVWTNQTQDEIDHSRNHSHEEKELNITEIWLVR